MPSEEEFRRLAKQELSYDAWGRLRDPATHAAYAQGSEPALFLGRGYTGHEHLTWFGVINANARLYDPVLGRFLSPDPYVQDPEYTQSYNRYSYCLNNPLKYTDPSGEVFGIDDIIMIGSMIICAYIGGVGANNGELNPLKWDYKSIDTYIGIGIGMIVGGTGAYGLLNPGTVEFVFGVTTPVAGAYLVGEKCDWSFQWTTPAGGGGEIPIGKKEDPANVSMSVNTPEKSKWDGSYFVGTETEAIQEHVKISKLWNCEINMWSTSKGYYYEPPFGVAYSREVVWKSNGERHYGVFVPSEEAPFMNTIKRAPLRVMLAVENGDLYIHPNNMFMKARVKYFAHTHPHNSLPNEHDARLILDILGLQEGIVNCWNGTSYLYIGPAPIITYYFPSN